MTVQNFQFNRSNNGAGLRLMASEKLCTFNAIVNSGYGAIIYDLKSNKLFIDMISSKGEWV